MPKFECRNCKTTTTMFKAIDAKDHKRKCPICGKPLILISDVKSVQKQRR